MSANDPAGIPTRLSLLECLRDLGNQEDWRQIFDTYWRLIHATAVKAGLTESEAEEVVQEVMIAAAKKLPEFTYQPGKDSLKGWLLAVTRWKVNDQYRKRLSSIGSAGSSGPRWRGCSQAANRRPPRFPRRKRLAATCVPS
jgi:DNA-directed RNA polymerase specialized sigma24 family protein